MRLYLTPTVGAEDRSVFDLSAWAVTLHRQLAFSSGTNAAFQQIGDSASLVPF